MSEIVTFTARWADADVGRVRENPVAARDSTTPRGHDYDRNVRHGSLFSRVTKYRDSVASTPRENRLTESFAAVLERVDGLSKHVAAAWLDPAVASPAFSERASTSTQEVYTAVANAVEAPRVFTQVPTRSAGVDGAVDLELRFLADERERVVRVEVKHGTGPHTDQLRRYKEDADAVVLLAPANQLPYVDESEVPRFVPQRAWEATGARIRAFTADTEAQQWLIDEFLAFLREERLMPIEAIGPEHLVALAHHADAREALRQLIATAENTIGAWGETKPGGGGDYGCWRNYGKAPNNADDDLWADGTWFEFKASTNYQELPPTSGEQLFFLAGLSAKGRGAELAGTDAARGRMAELEREGFQTFTEGGCRRFMRVASPTAVVRGDTLEQQGEALGRWVLESFALLSGQTEWLASLTPDRRLEQG